MFYNSNIEDTSPTKKARNLIPQRENSGSKMLTNTGLEQQLLDLQRTTEFSRLGQTRGSYVGDNPNDTINSKAPQKSKFYQTQVLKPKQKPAPKIADKRKGSTRVSNERPQNIYGGSLESTKDNVEQL
jgi:hypothetical protein